MCDRVDGKVGSQHSPIGLLPKQGDLDLTGLDLSPDNMKELMKVDPAEWRAEIPDIEAHFSTFGDRLPEELKQQFNEFRERLG